MKRISVRCPLVLNMGSQQFEFKPTRSYEVEDAVAAHPYLQAHLATFIDITPPAKEKPAAKKTTTVKEAAKKTTTVKEAENVKPASDA